MQRAFRSEALVKALRCSGSLAAILWATALGAPSHAADLPFSRPIAAPPAAFGAFSWTGFYVGGQIGYDWGRDKTTEYFTATGVFTGMAWSYNTKGFVGGAHAGFNYQLSPVVLGLEADIEGTDIKGGFVDPGGAGRMKIDLQSSVRARVGYAFDRFLIYGTGGVSFANINYVYSNPAGASESTTSLRTGWTAGGGVAYALTDNLIGRLEYRHANYGSFTYDSKVAFPGLLTGKQEPRSNTLRAGLSYQF